MKQRDLDRPLRLIIAGGGTGGHIFPAIAIANAIKELKPDTKFLFVGAKGKMEMEKIPQAGFNIVGLEIAGFNRSSLIKNIGLPFKLVKSFLQVRKIFSEFKPDATLGVGGYSSFPVLRFAQSKGINSFIHESNSFAGKTNILLGKRASRIYVASSGMEKFFPAEKILKTGNPVRKSIAKGIAKREDALKVFGLQPDRKTVLCIGGSLGAKSINEAICSRINDFEENNLQLIWQTGKPFFDQAKKCSKGIERVRVNDFITDMENAYAAADIVISRSGAMATAELCLVKKPVIFVPYPFAAEDHQTENAKYLVNHQAALMINDRDAATSLVPSIIALANDEGLQMKLKSNIGTLAVTDADATIAKDLLENI